MRVFEDALDLAHQVHVWLIILHCFRRPCQRRMLLHFLLVVGLDRLPGVDHHDLFLGFWIMLLHPLGKEQMVLQLSDQLIELLADVLTM